MRDENNEKLRTNKQAKRSNQGMFKVAYQDTFFTYRSPRAQRHLNAQKRQFS